MSNFVYHSFPLNFLQERVEDQETRDPMDGLANPESLDRRVLLERLDVWDTLDREVARDQLEIRVRHRRKGRSTIWQ